MAASCQSRSPPLSPPRQFPSEGFPLVAYPRLLEEEAFSWYTPEDFYPVRIGEIFKSRYQVVGKLGFGSASTAWLCRDLRGHEYVTLKVYANKQRQAQREVHVLHHIESIATKHAGARIVRKLKDEFEISGNDSTYLCLVHNPLGLTLSDFRLLLGGKLPPKALKAIVNYLLYALDFLHTEARVVHTDIQEGNIMFSITDETELEAFEKGERSEPSSRKVDGNRIIYASRGFMVPEKPGLPTLGDFGEARFGGDYFTEEVMPDLYRAPEILLKIPWDEKIDIWNLGLMVWDMLEGKHLFTERLPSREDSRFAHMARIVNLLGPPPGDLLERSDVVDEYFDQNGKLKEGTEMPTSLEQEEEVLSGQEKVDFLSFLRKMLQWRPEDRMSARQLMNDPWLKVRQR
ncbi:Serine/threonine protein kinase, putative [Tolypocladium paradoxum]|uniref:non-specific serine/threonine protein kinase n=1 Tax=Tolypocladium paradoxum TaxID=94208 RepID=A0A2S4L5U5_9HYPO|nr:Serine/threonine protein kinase, putative [Tolypocladium paradoxum]